MAVFFELSDLLRGHFVPTEPLNNKDGTLRTFHGAVRVLMGCDDAGLLAYENHVELRAALRSVFDALDPLIAEQSPQSKRSEYWMLEKDRTESEVLELLAKAESMMPDLDLTHVRGVPRPRIQGLGGVGKYRGTIATELARCVNITGRQYCEVIADLLPDTTLDVQLLARLEETEPCGYETWAEPPSEIPARLSKAMEKELKKTSGLTVRKFLSTLYEDWSEVDDDALLALLIRLTPDETGSS